MYILANRDIELSCDEAVVLSHGENSKSAYALALLLLAEKRINCFSLFSNFSSNPAEERVISIMNTKKATFLSKALLTLIVVLVTLIFATAASAPDPYASVQNNPETQKITEYSNLKTPSIIHNEICTNDVFEDFSALSNDVSIVYCAYGR